jgi:protein TonB
MGKIVKFCNSCDEGFAEKFAFCPNCGQTLQKFEMSPVIADAAPEAVAAPAVEPEIAAAAPEVFAVTPEVVSEEAVAEFDEPVDMGYETAKLSSPEIDTVKIHDEPVLEDEDDQVIERVEALPVKEVPAPAYAAANVFTASKPVDADSTRVSLEDEHYAHIRKGEFYVTVIEEKNVGKRNMLMLGTLGAMVFALLAGTVVSLYSKDLEVGSINDDIFNAVLVDSVPAVVEEEIQPKDKDDGGGGGGGGREEEEEVTQGDLADQSRTPTRPPDAKVFRSDNFELKTPPPQTEGDRKFEKKFDRWGDPNGRFASFSNGTGSGGGQGSGVGTGQGSGRGTGAGSGDGSGSGSGLGDGNGSGSGSGGSGVPPPPKRVGVTQALKILSKPRPGYTDSARQNNVQGTVILRVTFLASGQVGSISAVKGLPNGLTEQAIAAARRINFEPKKVDGVGQPVTRQIEYTFSIY